MSTIERTINSLDERESVTTISANARIDYILRFSKQAVLVIDEDPEIYTQVGNQFLGSLNKDHNAAFVSISSKLNDIQIRCRIIEQLFGNTLFDPEQPLSVNVIKLSEAKNESISIVIAHVESLSLQLTYELCQLAEIAKKLNKTINVLLLGKKQAAKNLSENKHLFDNKISILLAENGQLISFNSSLLKDNTGFSRSVITAIILFLVICTVAGLFTYYYLSQKDENKAVNTSLTEEEYKKVFVKAPASLEKEVQQIEQLSSITTMPEKTVEIATSVEIFNSLITQQDKEIPVANGRNEVNIANTDDDISASETSQISPTEPTRSDLEITAPKIDNSSTITAQIDNKDKITNPLGDEAYYQGFTSGYAVQLASFVKDSGFTSFVEQHKNIALYGYTRSLNGKVSHIVTSQVYTTNIEAKKVINELPEELKQRGPWIKSIQAINNEIKLYQQSR